MGRLDLGKISVDVSSYQKKDDPSLQTTNKTVVGGINEVNTNKLDKGGVSEAYNTAKKIEDKIKALEGRPAGDFLEKGGYTGTAQTLKEYTDTKVAGLVNSAPSTLDTLKELSDALGNDPNFAATVTNKIGAKLEKGGYNGTANDLKSLIDGKLGKTEKAQTAGIADTANACSGNSATATKLATPRTINGVAFDGTANITVTDNTKLPLTGGTVNGSIISTNLTANNYLYVRDFYGTGTDDVSGRIWFAGNKNASYNDRTLRIDNVTGVKINDNTIWHGGNFDPNSKAAINHNHDSSYAAKTHTHSEYQPKGDYAISTHTHTASQISGLPTSLKNPTALSIQLNGGTADVYDGSVAKTINITPSSIGAQVAGSYAASNHNHSGVYQPAGSYASSSHTHDDRYLGLSGGTVRGNLTVTGSLVSNNDITSSGNVTAFSDIRLKTDIVKISNPLDKIDYINGYTFNMKGHKDRMTGVIAQELQKVLPEAVVENENGYLTVAYGNIAGLLIEAIKELKEKVNKQQLEIDRLRGGV